MNQHRKTIVFVIFILFGVNLSFAMYDTYAGRFMQQDPLGTQPVANAKINPFESTKQYMDGLSLYQYVLSNPISDQDPTGLNLYAVDGTWADFEDRGNVVQFYQSTGEPRKYWSGPDRGLTGADCRKIVNGVYNYICEEFCAAKQKNEDITINMVGWSRGGVIILEVADYLNAIGCLCCKGKSPDLKPPFSRFNPIYASLYEQYKPVPVNWLGLFDAVDMTPTLGMTTSVPSNVNSYAHAIKTKTTGRQRIFPTIPVSGKKFWRDSGEKTTHSDIGTSYSNNNALRWIVEQAQNAGVKVRYAPF